MSAPPLHSSPTDPTSLEVRSRTALLGLVAEAVVELLAHYDVTVSAIAESAEPAELRGHQVAGIVGYAEEGLRGAIAIRGLSDFVRACLPCVPTGPRSASVLGDWIAELANQLAGRTKNKLLRHGAAFHITIPTYAVAYELLVLGCDPPHTSWLDVTTSAGRLVVMLELRTETGITLVLERETEDAVALAEGELMMF